MIPASKPQPHKPSLSSRQLPPIRSMLIPLLCKLLILLRRLQRLDLRRRRYLDLSQPALSFRALVDNRRLILQHVVRLNHRPADRSHDVGCGFDRFYGANGFAGGDFEVRGGEFDEDDVAEGFGCVFGDADCSCKRGKISLLWITINRDAVLHEHTNSAVFREFHPFMIIGIALFPNYEFVSSCAVCDGLPPSSHPLRLR